MHGKHVSWQLDLTRDCRSAAPAGLLKAHWRTLAGTVVFSLPRVPTGGNDTSTGTWGRPLHRARGEWGPESRLVQGPPRHLDRVLDLFATMAMMVLMSVLIMLATMLSISSSGPASPGSDVMQSIEGAKVRLVFDEEVRRSTAVWPTS